MTCQGVSEEAGTQVLLVGYSNYGWTGQIAHRYIIHVTRSSSFSLVCFPSFVSVLGRPLLIIL